MGDKADWITNTPEGGSGGKPFQLLPSSPDAFIRSLDVWCEDSPGEHYSFAALQIVWSTGEQSERIGTKSDVDHTYFTFSDDDKITHCTLRAGGRVDNVQFQTAQGRSYGPGGDGGDEYPQMIGNGRLVGFVGNAGNGIDKAGTVFQK